MTEVYKRCRKCGQILEASKIKEINYGSGTGFMCIDCIEKINKKKAAPKKGFFSRVFNNG